VEKVQEHDIEREPPIQQFSTEEDRFPLSPRVVRGESDYFVLEHRGGSETVLPRLAELEGKEIHEVMSPAAVVSPASEMPSEKSQLFYNGYAVAERRFREEATAQRHDR
jgi:hypothetical protein